MKKTLLMAAAALAAGVISSQAGVYSQNIVGYANVSTPVGGHEYLISVPFTVGVSNGLNEVFGTSLPAFSQVLIWGGTGYTTYVYDNTDPIGLGTSVVWYNANEDAAVTVPTVPVGQGFFLIPNSPITNVFAGAISVSVGTSNNMALPTGGHEYLVSSAVPYAGAVTNGTASGGGPNLNNLPAFSQILIWNGTGFDTTVYDNTDPIGLGTGVVWYNANEDAAVPCPTISVGQSFFVIPNSSYTWTTGL